MIKINHIDVLIVGGGVAGLSCALFTSKAGLSTIVIDDGESQFASVKNVMNYTGVSKKMSGKELLDQTTIQVEELEGKITKGQVIDLDLQTRPYSITIKTKNETENNSITYTCSYLVLAVNLGYSLLEKAGFQLEVNEYVPSKKIRYAQNVHFDGRTNHPGIFVAGLLANIPSQAIIAAGQGAFVGVQIASDHLGQPYMWHD